MTPLTQEKPGRKQLRSFGLLVGVIFGVIALWPRLVHQRPWRLWAVVVAVLLILPALVAPGILAPVHKVWMRIGHVLGWVNTRIILAISFYLIFLPMGLIMRLLGKDPMNRRFLKGEDSYRVPRKPRPASHLKHQF